MNAIAPWSLTPGQNTSICVRNGGNTTNCITRPVDATVPGVFTVDGEYVAALNQDGTVNAANNPAQPGSVVTIFVSGLGAISPSQQDGALIDLPLPVNVTPAGVAELVNTGPPHYFVYYTSLAIDYAGPAPFEVAGVTQINFHVTDSGQLCISTVVGSLFNCSWGFHVHVAGE